MMSTVLAWVLEIAILPLSIGVVLTFLDALRAQRGWLGNMRWLTFGAEFWWPAGVLFIGALLIELSTSLVFHSGTLTAYIAALAIGLLHAGIFILGVLLSYCILRTPGLIRRAVRRRDDPLKDQ